MKPWIKSTRRMQLLFLIPLFLLSAENSDAQENDLSFAYYKAASSYDNGRIDTAYNILVTSLENSKLYKKTSRNTKANIYRLSALSSILLEKQDEARTYIKMLLACKPHYNDNFREGDLLEFKRIVNEYTVLPWLSIGAVYFRDYSTISVEKTLTGHQAAYIPEVYGFSEYGAGLFVENTLSKRISVGVGINLFKVAYSYQGAPVPLSPNNAYNLDFRYIETPAYANYRFRYDKKLSPYLQLGVAIRYYTAQKDKYNTPHRYKSDEYGTFYMQNEYSSDGHNSILALFYQNYEYFDIMAGGGITYNFRSSCLDLNLGYIPFRLHNDPLKDIDSESEIPDSELFKDADETIVTDIKRIFRFSLSYKLFWKYKAF